MQTTRQPYELLVRWTPDGTISGTHVQWRYIIADDAGAVLGETLSSVMTLEQGMTEGFPAKEVLRDSFIPEM